MKLIRHALGWIATSLIFVSASAQVQSIGVAGDGEFTRITLASETELKPETFLRTTDVGMVIELVPERFTLTHAPFFGEPTGGILAYTLTADRIVFELDRPLMVMRELDLPPSGSERLHRYVLDLSSASEARFLTAAQRDEKRRHTFEANRSGEAAAVMASLKDTSVPVEVAPAADVPTEKSSSGFAALMKMAAQRRHVVVIDPGHGGRDPGALAITGGKESEVVLQTALILKEELSKDPRYLVRLTRDTDVYVEHEDRVTKARNWGADLFISLHADANPSPATFGASVYTISTRGEARIKGASEKYGWHLPLQEDTSAEVSAILKDLTVRETKSNSTIFAELLVPELGRAGPLLNNALRQKNLFVLLAPDVPAVLVEIGFLTNKADAARLKSRDGRRKSAMAIKRAIDAYFDRKDLLFAEN